MGRRRASAQIHRLTAGVRTRAEVAAIPNQQFMNRSQVTTTRGSSFKANACAVKTLNRAVRWLCCVTAIAACQAAWSQQPPNPFTVRPAMPPVVDSGNLSDSLPEESSGPVQPTEMPTSARQQSAALDTSSAAQPPAYVIRARPPAFTRVPSDTRMAAVDGSVPTEPVGAAVSQFLPQAYQLPAETDPDGPELQSPPTDRALRTQFRLPVQRPAASAILSRPSPKLAYDSPVDQMGALRPVEAPDPIRSLAQPAFVTEESPVVAPRPKSARRLADDTPKTPNRNSFFLGLRNQLLGYKGVPPDGQTSGSKVDGGRKAQSATASTSNTSRAAMGSDSNQTAPTNTPPSGGSWSGLTRPFNMETNEAPTRRPSARQTANAAVASDKITTEVPESERVPRLLLPFYQTKSASQNGRSGEQLTQSRAQGLGQDIEHSVRNSTLLRQLSLPVDSDLRARPSMVAGTPSGATNETRGSDWTPRAPSELNPFMMSSRPRRVTDAADGVMSAAYLQDGSLPDPGGGAQSEQSNLRGDAGTADGEGTNNGGNGSRTGRDNQNNHAGDNGQQQKNEKLATADKLGEKPEDRSLEFLRAETVLLKPGKHQFDIGFQYTIQERNFPILFHAIDQTGPIDDVHVKTTSDKALSYNVDEARFKTRQLEVPMQLRCGLLDHVQVFVGAPVGWSNTEVDLNHFDDNRNDGGIGDIYWGSTIQFREAEANCPYIIGTCVATAPTGGDPFTGVSGFAPSAPSMGNGFWRLAGNLLFIQPLDPVTFFYGAGIRGSFAHDYIGSTFQPGMEYNYTFGMGFAINEKVTFSSQLFGEFQSELKANGQQIDGSSQEPIALQLAATIARPCEHYVEPYVQFGVTRDAPSVNLGITWTY